MATVKTVEELKYELTEPISVPVFNRQGESIGTVEVNPADFGGKISVPLMHEAVLMYEANRRLGTHSTLRRGEVAGSTKKLFRQKGTGNARAGTKRTNKRRGGGTAKGPKPRDYRYALPRKAIRNATRMAILSKFKDGEAVIIDDFGITAPKTKEMFGVLKALKLDAQTTLIGMEAANEPLYLSARNIEGVEIMPVQQFNTYVVLRYKRLLLTRSALEALRTNGTTQTPPAQA